jgi:hypothetical protein
VADVDKDYLFKPKSLYWKKVVIIFNGYLMIQQRKMFRYTCDEIVSMCAGKNIDECDRNG